MSMKFAIKISIGLVCLLVLVTSDDMGKSNNNFNDQCQALKCDSTREICRLKPKCDEQKSKCIYCAPKDDLNLKPVSKTLLASSISQLQAPLAPRLLAKSNDNHDSIDFTDDNKLNNETSYDDYYEYDEDETSDKDDLGEEDDYLDDYAEPIDSFLKETNTIRKFGVCPKVLATNEKCDPSKKIQSECRFDTDCSGEQKCCESTCGKRVCNLPIKMSVSVCPSSFTCTLNCRLGFRTDANGCLLCECQSCPSMDHCQKNCPSGYLKDLFGCDICECSDRCPPFSCSIMCPSEVGFAKSSDGCPLCQCATTKTKPIEYTSSCQDDVHCPPGFRCLNDARNVPMCQAVPESNKPSVSIDKCPQDFAATCSLQCANNQYAVDENGCPICACASKSSTKACPLMKCQANCGELGYKINSNGCRTCECASKSSTIECSRVMCRMFCAHGFRRDENGCEICACNSSPQPCPKLTCNNICLNGYQKDYSGCQTCACNNEITADICSPMTCDLDCKYGFERDASGCSLCSCNKCPVHTCRRFCMYGFKKNSDGCDVCECDWAPIAEKISCSERIPCEGNRVCNLNLKYCELVSPEKVNWFVYDFAIKSNLFQDAQFIKTFKRDLINNIAKKYDLEPTQIAVSSVEDDGMTSFQIMPFFIESADDFQKKMDQIDIDLNTHEFRSVIPTIAYNLDKKSSKSAGSFWTRYIQPHSTLALYTVAICVGIVALFFATIFFLMVRYRLKHPGRSESKSPIYDTSYHQAPTEDDHYHAVHAPDGTAYVVIESDDMHSSNDRRALV